MSYFTCNDCGGTEEPGFGIHTCPTDGELISKLNDRIAHQKVVIEDMRDALMKLRRGWLYWPAKHQPDPRVTMYQSRTLDEIEKMAKEALGEE